MLLLPLTALNVISASTKCILKEIGLCMNNWDVFDYIIDAVVRSSINVGTMNMSWFKTQCPIDVMLWPTYCYTTHSEHHSIFAAMAMQVQHVNMTTEYVIGPHLRIIYSPLPLS